MSVDALSVRGGRGTGVEDPGHELWRIFGVPPNRLGAAATEATAGVGWYLDRQLRPDAVAAAWQAPTSESVQPPV